MSQWCIPRASGVMALDSESCALCSDDDGGTLHTTAPFKSLVTVQAAPEVGGPHLHTIYQQSFECLLAMYCVEPTTYAVR